MSEHDSAERQLIERVCATPEDDDAALVLADLWRSHGDPRGEALGLELMLARGELARGARHVAACRQARAAVEAMLPLDPSEFTLEWARGRVVALHVHTGVSPPGTAALLSHSPLLRRLHLPDISPGISAAIRPLGGLEVLHLDRVTFESLREVSTGVPRLHTLHVELAEPYDDWPHDDWPGKLVALLNDVLPNLCELGLTKIRGEHLGVLLETPSSETAPPFTLLRRQRPIERFHCNHLTGRVHALGRLRSLSIARVDGARGLFALPDFRRLRRLALRDDAIMQGFHDLREFAHALPEVEELALPRLPLDKLAELLRATHVRPRRLEISIADTVPVQYCLRVLAATPVASQLEELRLGCFIRKESHVESLYRFERLRRLELSDRTTRALHVPLPRLQATFPGLTIVDGEDDLAQFGD